MKHSGVLAIENRYDINFGKGKKRHLTQTFITSMSLPESEHLILKVQRILIQEKKAVGKPDFGDCLRLHLT